MSPKYSLNKEDGKRILSGAAVALSGALLTYVSQVVTETNFGEYTPIVVAMFSVVSNTLRKYLQG